MTTDKALHALHQLCHLAAAEQGGDLADGQLLARFRAAGEEAAFTVLVLRHGPMVLGTCRRVLGNRHDAEDAFQATFLALARQAGSIRRLASVGGWLYGVARNIATKARTAAARRRRHERRCPGPLETLPVQPDRQETRELLEEELGRLPDKYLGPVVLCYLEGKTHEDAARELGCPKSSLTSRLARARELLHRRLTRRGVTVPSGFVVGLLLEETVSAGVNAGLVLQTVRLAAGGGKATVPAHLTLLAQGAPLGGTGGKWLVALVLAAGLAIGALLMTVNPAPETPPATLAGAPGGNAPRAGGKEMPRAPVDRHGDPLPAGAVARFGTLRLYLRHGIYGLAYSPDGKLLASTGDSEGVILWDAATGKEVRRLRGSCSGYHAIQFTQGGKEVVAAYVGVLERWDAATGKHLGRSAQGEHRFTVAADGKTLASVGRGGLAIHDPASLRVLRRIKAPGVYVDSPLALSPDGRLLAATIEYKKIALWDVASGKPAGTPIVPYNPVRALAFAPDGTALVAGLFGGTVQAWDVKTGKERYRLDLHKGHVTDVAFAPGGKVFATAAEDQTVRVWDAALGKELAHCTGHFGGLHAVAFAPDGKTLASGGTDRTIRLWAPVTGKERGPRSGHVYAPRAAAFLPDARTVVSVGLEGMQLWRALSGEGLALFAPLRTDRRANVALRADGRVAVVLYDAKKAELWDVLRRKVVRELAGVDFNAYDLTVGPGDTLAMTASGYLKVWGPPGRPAWRAYDKGGGQVHRLTLSRDGKWAAVTVATVRPQDNPGLRERVELWDVTTGKRARTWDFGDKAQFGRLALSPDGALLAAAHGRPLVVRGDLGGGVVFDTATGKRLHTLEGHAGGIAGVAFSADGRAVATGGAGGDVCVWEAATGQLRRRFAGHRGEVSTLAFSPDGHLLVSSCAADDPTLLVWDLTGRLRDGRLGPTKLTEEKLAKAWGDLLEADTKGAYQATWELAAASRQAVPFLAKKLRPVQAPAAGEIERLVKDLGSARFEVRRRAEKQLEAFVELAAEELKKAADKGTQLEVRQRAGRLLDALTSPSGERLRRVRAIEALAACGSEARPLLKALAGGAAEARLTREAQAALTRLAEREKTP